MTAWLEEFTGFEVPQERVRSSGPGDDGPPAIEI